MAIPFGLGDPTLQDTMLVSYSHPALDAPPLAFVGQGTLLVARDCFPMVLPTPWNHEEHCTKAPSPLSQVKFDRPGSGLIKSCQEGEMPAEKPSSTIREAVGLKSPRQLSPAEHVLYPRRQ